MTKQVTAEDLVRAIQNNSIGSLAYSLGIPLPDIPEMDSDETEVLYLALAFAINIADLITLPEPTENRVQWRPPASWEEVYIARQMVEDNDV